MKTVGIVTSGGDAPGMNAAIRAIVRIADSMGFQVVGFHRGWSGLVTNDFERMTPRSVSGIIQMGGTILRTCRCPEVRTEEGIKAAAGSLNTDDIDGLVVIGGDGSFKMAREISRETDTHIVGVPATIDNDVFGTDDTIGFDTAVNTAVEEIDKIRDTATSHDRIFVVEVMGRKRGFLAAMVGLTVGSEIILVPEIKYRPEDIYDTIRENVAKGKKSGIIVAAEGIGDNHRLAMDIEKNTGLETRLSILGYAQRGGSPTARSRYLASEFGNKAVELISQGQGNRVVTLQNGKITSIGLEESCLSEKPLNVELLKLAKMLAK